MMMPPRRHAAKSVRIVITFRSATSGTRRRAIAFKHAGISPPVPGNRGDSLADGLLTGGAGAETARGAGGGSGAALGPVVTFVAAVSGALG
jgi:hypothetical protein